MEESLKMLNDELVEVKELKQSDTPQKIGKGSKANSFISTKRNKKARKGSANKTGNARKSTDNQN